MADGSLITVVVGVFFALLGLAQLYIKRIDTGSKVVEQLRDELHIKEGVILKLKHDLATERGKRKRDRELFKREYGDLKKRYIDRTKTAERITKLYRAEVRKNNPL